jgi:hypothetical protein
VTTAPGGDAMTVRFHRDADTARLRREKVRRPIAWRTRPGPMQAAAEFAAQGKHCMGRRGTRRCRGVISVVVWRWWRSAAAGRVLVSERFLCDEHAAEFAARHRIEIEPTALREPGGER